MSLRWAIAKLLEISAICGFGIALMLGADSYEHMITVGVAYIIAMCAVLVVAAADTLERTVSA